MAELLAEGLDVRFGQVVTSIEYGQQGVTLHTATGEMFLGDAAVVTVSLGVLKVQCFSVNLSRLPEAYVKLPVQLRR